ncbi:unnamed protein product [Ixodes persulcatus]
MLTGRADVYTWRLFGRVSPRYHRMGDRSREPTLIIKKEGRFNGIVQTPLLYYFLLLCSSFAPNNNSIIVTTPMTCTPFMPEQRCGRIFVLFCFRVY